MKCDILARACNFWLVISTKRGDMISKEILEPNVTPNSFYPVLFSILKSSILLNMSQKVIEK